MLTTILGLFLLAAPAPARTTLDIYFIDVEGGASTLIVAPSGESLLVDTGWPRPDQRDPKRIQAAMAQAGITKIDNLMITHFHRDHWGGVGDLAKLVPIGHFYDHGAPNALDDDKQAYPALYDAYMKATGGKATALKPGDTIPLKDVQVRVVSSDHAVGGATGKSVDNKAVCAGAKEMDADPTDNGRSAGVVLTFGKFRFLDLGDLTWNIEQKLVCPVNTLGKINLYQVTHHGSAISNNPAVLSTIQPQVAIEDNGPAKGGDADTYKRLAAVKGMEIFQLHQNLKTGPENNTTPEKTANLEKEDGCAGYSMKVSVDAGGGKFHVTNGRTGQSWDFTTRP